jgi:branched-chain amino acid transport system substrate-binding protein
MALNVPSAVRWGAVALIAACIGSVALAADKVKVGFVSTLSGPSSALGVDIRDGFLLAVKLNGGKLGGLPAEVLVSDDQFKPDVAKQLFEKNVKRDHVDFMTGVVFSNIMLAALPEALDNNTIYISPNAAPSSMAGKDCNPLFYAVSWPNDAYHEAAGQFANQRDLKSVYLLAPNYQAGKDSLAGFKRMFKGQVVGENYTKLGQLDYAAELAEIRAAKPQALYIFLPGGMGINFIKQFVGAGLGKDMQLVLPGFSADQDVINPVGPAMSGLFNTAHWSPDFANAANQKFMAEFEKEYKLRRRAADQRRGARREGQARRPRGAAQGTEGGALRLGAWTVQVQHQPIPDSELLRAHGGRRRQGRPDQQVVQHANPQGPR